METKNPEWQLNDEHASKAKFAKFARNHPREFASLFANLDKVVSLLDGGHKVGSFHLGFFRSEGSDVYRIGQTGVAAAKESRLYVYPDESSRVMYVLTVGTKETQSKDINEAKEIAENLKPKKESK